MEMKTWFLSSKNIFKPYPHVIEALKINSKKHLETRTKMSGIENVKEKKH